MPEPQHAAGRSVQAPSPSPRDRHVPDGERVSLARTFGGRSVLRETVETIVLALVVFLVLNTTTGRFQVRGSSMEPTLHDGQYLLVSKAAYWIHPPQRGDIIVFRPPISLGEDYIKRIIGLPGEEVRIENGSISVDGVTLEEPYITQPSPYTGAWQLGQNEFFVLGDNRANSNDSHSWGVLPRSNMVGKAWVSYWPPEDWRVVPHYSFPEPTTEGD